MVAKTQLTAVAVRALRHSGRSRKPERRHDGGGLYLQCAPGGAKTWAFRFTLAGRERWMGLGPVDAVPLAEARRRAAEARAMVRDGRDPIAERARARRAAEDAAETEQRTFAAAVDRFLAAHETAWRNPKHRAQWRSTLGLALEAFGARHVATITTDDVLAVLRPLWARTPETGSRLRGRIERVLAWAKAAGWRAGDNPAAWRDALAHHLPPPRRVKPVRHHAALDWRRMPDLWAALATRAGIAAAALRFLILTAARSGEVRGMRWREIDPELRIWTVPGERMKAGKAHRVPLSDDALAVLDPLRPLAGDDPAALVFPSPRRGMPLSDMALTAVLRDLPGDWRDALGRRITAHGFRSAFRDWCGETQAAPRDVAEAALAHTIRDATERAYARGDLLEARRSLMGKWTAYVTGAAAVVLPLERRARR
jgi:integrase